MHIISSDIKMSLTARLLVYLLCVCSASAQNSNEQRENQQDQAFGITQGLYTAVRNIAFPEHQLTNEPGVENRFLLLMPGKVLNYFDYYPGREYTSLTVNYNSKNKEAIVPPRIMERWFDLADVIPSPNPMNGQDTGKSLSNVYASILHEIKLLGLDEKVDTATAIYNQAVNFLNKMVDDPDNSSLTAPRLTLYERYRNLYNDYKLEMEDQIAEKRENSGSLNYELWFQRHYPSLISRVESAYTKWMVFGQKERVETHIAFLNTGSSGKLLEEARAVLRAAGVQSLDRTRTIYPVYFEPSDWYKYLLPKMQRPSQDQLQLMIGKLYSKINAIEAIVEHIDHLSNTSTIARMSGDVQNQYNAQKRFSVSNITRYMESKYLCMKDGTGNSQNCKRYQENTYSAIDSLTSESNIYAQYQSISYAWHSRAEYRAFLIKEKDSLNDQLSRLSSLLGETSPYLGGILDASPLAVSNISDAYKDDQWLQFEFDSKASHETSDDETTSRSVSAGFGFRVFLFSVGGSHSSSKTTADYRKKFASSQLKAKGELLRVNIKRPWFKPELFENPELGYEQLGDGLGGVTYVAPGKQLTETEFYETLQTDDVNYRLPEYPTAFLLARNIELEFSGLDSDTVNSAMSEMSHTSGGGGFLFFRASASVTKSRQTSHVSVSKTADGMRIKIPGAQTIGYYTQKMPRFPADH